MFVIFNLCSDKEFTKVLKVEGKNRIEIVSARQGFTAKECNNSECGSEKQPPAAQKLDRYHHYNTKIFRAVADFKARL